VAARDFSCPPMAAQYQAKEIPGSLIRVLRASIPKKAFT
jgi:hypothetical protein